AAGLAAANPAFPAAALDLSFRRMAAAVEGDGDYHEADLEFHKTIFLGSDNQFLRQLVPLLTNTLKVSFSLSVISMDTARSSLPMHRDVADAIIGRDPAAARSALTKLIEAAREDILEVLPQITREERVDGEGY
ncbi:MAG: FadR family transcriptional regulator, partial [Pseudaminobacter sp.]|nr:FadR family transcriptional regulator [Pseudaminobacter sp.]